MILYRLKCVEGHEFDAWFCNSKAYDDQITAREVACPHCSSIEVGKAIMAPNLNTRNATLDDHIIDDLVERAHNQNEATTTVVVQRLLRTIHVQVQKLCEDVGENFVEEARKIHYNETAPRNIYGQITLEEAHELQDEGVEFYYLPSVPSHNA